MYSQSATECGDLKGVNEWKHTKNGMFYYSTVKGKRGYVICGKNQASHFAEICAKAKIFTLRIEAANRAD